MTTSRQGIILILCGTLLFSLGGVGIKTCQLDGWTIAGFRSAFAAIFFLCLIPNARRHWSWRSFLVGTALGTSVVCFVLANKTTTAAHSIFIQSSAPLWVLMISPIFLREKLARHDWVTLPVFIAGLAMLFVVPSKATPLSPSITTGNWLALLSGISYGLLIVGLRWLADRGAESAVVCGNGLAFAACLVVISVTDNDFQMINDYTQLKDWGLVALMGCFQIGLAYVLYTRGLRHVTAIRGSLIGLVEPVLNPIWVFLVFREEKPTVYTLLGGAAILAATTYHVWSSRDQLK